MVQQVDGYFGFFGVDYVVVGDNVNFFYWIIVGKVELLGFYGEDFVGLGIEGIFCYEFFFIEWWVFLQYLDVNMLGINISFVFFVDDLLDQIMDLLFIFLDFICICFNFECIEEVDVWGILIIFGGIYDVLCEKWIEEQQICLDVKIGFFNWFDIMDIVFELLQLEVFEFCIMISYCFFSNEVVEFIVEV